GVSAVTHYSIPEEMKEGSVVANLALDLGLDVKTMSSRKMRLDVISNKKYLEMNKETGELYILEKIDREYLCSKAATTCFIKIEVTLENPIRIFNIEIEILDINDNAPRFRRDTIHLDVSESTHEGERFSLSNAVDPDIGTNSIKTYHLSESEYFDIEIQTARDGAKFADLILRRVLDRETQAVHSLILTAVDGGVPARSGTSRIIVRVLDTNDNAPKFDKDIYKIYLMENSPIGNLVAKLNATDLDEGSNSDITYSFSLYTSEKTQEAFSLNANNGEIRVKGVINYEDFRIYDMEVIATDKGASSLSEQCKVTILVTDMNDNHPEISIKSFSNPIKEDVAVDTVIAVVSVSDKDSEENGHIDVHISEKLPFALRELSDNYYELVVSEPLDREKVAEYDITFIVTDRGNPPLSDNETVILELLDVNDNVPRFSQSTYTIQVMENNPPGGLLSSINAVDPDLHENQYLVYFIVEKEIANTSMSMLFSINPENGNLYALKTFDYEIEREFVFHIEARDSGVPPLSSTAKIIVRVLDTNDNAPQFDQDRYTINLMENSPIGSLVIKLNATDKDESTNSDIEYSFSLYTSEKTQSTFGLNSNNGEIRVKEMINYEDFRIYDAEIIAKDKGANSLSGQCKVTILIKDMNDNHPEISVKSFSSPIKEDVAVDTVIAVISVNDKDSGENGEIDIQISDRLPFKLREASDSYYELVISEPLDREKVPEYDITFTVTDRGNPPLSDNDTITLELLDVNDNVPQFPQSFYTIQVMENNPPGAIVGSLTAHDPDLHENQYLVYFIFFRVETDDFGDGGKVPVLVLQKILDRENSARHALILTAVDGGKPQKTGTLTINVVVSDINDNAPNCGKQKYMVTVKEDAPYGTFLLRINATDSDDGENGEIEYSLRSTFRSGTSDLFDVNSKTGELWIKGSLNYEDTHSYELKILAADKGSVSLSTQCNVLVKVEDVNDNQPEIDVTSLSDRISEDARPGTVVAFIGVTDLDSGVNGQVVCSLPQNIPFELKQSSDSTYFSLVTKGILDKESSSNYDIAITAKDFGTPPQTSTKIIHIDVVDVNDNSPAFTQSPYTFYIAENNKPGMSVFSVSAADVDDGENARVSYLIDHINSDPSVKSFININEESGAVCALNVFDFELQKTFHILKHELLLTALDGGNPPKSSNLNITITVLDTNDNQPVCSQDVYSISVNEDVPVGKIVIRVNATDPDEGSNGEIEYSWSRNTKSKIQDIFHVDRITGEIKINGDIDFEDIQTYRLNIQASDKGQPPLSVDCRIIIKIIDVNDNKPEIEVTSILNAVPEDSKPGTVISLISVRDKDSGINGKVVCSISGNLPFELKPSVEDNVYSLITNKRLDRELISHYDIVLTAKDMGQPALSSFKSLSVQVSDINDNAPQFHKNPLELYLIENNVPGTSIFSVKANDKDLNENADITYQIMKGETRSNDIWSVLNINTETGVIHALKSFDFETTKTFQFHVLATDSGSPPLEIHYVVVDIMDINDNAPRFPDKQQKLEIAESTMPGARFQLHNARDPDIGLHSVRSYKLSKNEHFDLEIKDRDDEKMPFLVLQKALDRERKSKHELTLTALDGGNPQMSGTLNVTVTVLDINDNRPVFSQEVYTVHLQENVQIGTVVLKVNATDLDEGLNGEIRYSLGSNLNRKLYDVFDLDTVSGEIRVKGEIDFEMSDVHRLDVLASDKGTPPMTVNCRVTVKILDVNDNAPEIEITSLFNVVPEDSKPGTVISLISLLDKDSDIGTNSIRTYVLSKNNYFELEIRDNIDEEKIPILALHKALDREQKGKHSLVLTAVDGGTPPRSGTINITVTVLDINDNRPTCSKDAYHVTIRENTPVGTSIVRVNATDLDEGLNGDIIYSFGKTIQRKVHDAFSLDEITGEIKIKKPIDFEENEMYRLSIQASDKGQPPMTTDCRVIIKITDENDNYPEIEVTSLSNLVPEDSQTGTVVSLISVTDKDVGVNGKVICSISNDVPFELKGDEKIPFLVLQRGLDRERKAEHELTLTAVDGGNPPKSGTLNLTVTVLDINDNPPVFSQEVYTVHLEENAVKGTIVIKVSATDLDDGLNGDVIYSLSSKLNRKVYDTFDLDAESGEIRVKSKIDFENTEVYRLDVLASDKDMGQPPKTAQKSLNLLVLDVNDNRPEFSQNPIELYLMENNIPGASIFSVTASDRDVNENAVISYSILRDWGEDRLPFLVLQRPLDRERRAEHNLILTAFDGGSPHRSGTLNITVIVLDVNDNRPMFSQEIYTTTLKENTPVGTVVLKLQANDNDYGINGEVSFVFGGGKNQNAFDIFVIDNVTGEIKVKGEVDFEKTNIYKLDIQASDGGQPPLTTESRVIIKILDVNDNQPCIEITSLSNTVSEDTRPGTVISLISVSDRDTDVNGKVKCTISDIVPFDLKPSIQENMYSLVIKEPLDRELVSHYDITIKATDLGQPPLFTIKTLSVQISDVNDNKPVFPQNSVDLYIFENNFPGGSIFSISASDNDVNENALISYNILKGGDKLKDMASFLNINSETGVIYALKTFDFESTKTFQFHVLATDSGTPSLSSNVTVNVFILDQNDNAPVILNPVSTNGSAEGTSFQLHAARDQDTTTNSVCSYKLSQNTNFEIDIKTSDGDKIPFLVIRKPLDREQTEDYRLVVTAEDGGNPPKTGTLNIIVKVLDINDNRPVFSQNIYTVTLQENAPVGTVVITVKATDSDQGSNGNVEYAFVKTINYKVNDVFQLNAITGEIKVKVTMRNLDREIVSSYNIIITATDLGQPPLSTIKTLPVLVSDVNDNRPQFYQTYLELYLLENNAPGASIFSVSAFDDDSEENAVLSYHIIRNPGAQNDMTSFLNINSETVLQKPLDREQHSKHLLSLTAFDGGNPPKSGTLEISIFVIDVNDNIPVFTQEMYTVTLNENVPIGTIITTVNASDADDGLNGELVYALKRLKGNTKDLFQLDNVTGEISVKGNIDYEENEMYRLNVQATDKGQPPMTGDCRVVIKVTDANDNKPEIHITSLSNMVLEDSKRGTVIALVSVSDMDSGVNGKVICSLSGNTPFELKPSVKDNMYSLVTKNGLDRELISYYDISIKASDLGQPPQSSEQFLKVLVADVNDNSPEFPQNPLELYLLENNSPGELMFSVSATDGDINENAVVTYSIIRRNGLQNDMTSFINVNAENGKIMLQKPLDREQHSKHLLSLTAFDGGNPPKSGTLEISIFVIDVNDNIPVFTQEIYTVTLNENVPIGTIITTVNASDADDGLNGELVYALKRSQSNTKDLFQLDSVTGEISVKGNIDYEENEVYRLNVQATDKGQPPMTGDCRVVIKVTDANDNKPEIHITSLSNMVLEDSKRGTVIALVSVSDMDSGVNGKVICSLSDAGLNALHKYTLSPNNYFELDIKTREEDKIPFLILKKQLDREQTTMFNLTLTAFDGGKPERSGSVNITITVVDINDNAPLFDRQVYSVTLEENVEIGSLVVKLHATDLDEGANGQVVYGFDKSLMRKEFEIFEINSNTGDITVKGSIDFEEQRVYELDIQASDKGQVPLTGHCSIIISIKDLNDNTPEIDVTSLSTDIVEDSKPGTIISLISASDRDSGENGMVICSLTDDIPFELKPSFQKSMYSLITKDLLDRETISLYTITIMCKDRGEPSLSSQKTIQINIADVNDNSPVFTQNPFYFYISENNTPGTSIFSINAFDID
ncbi:protocadherin Fat 4, partial [Silurus asotus]